MYPSSYQHQKSRRESSFREWKCPRGLLAWLWSSWIDYVVVQHFSRLVTIPSSSSLQMVSWYWLFSFSSFVDHGVSVHVFVHVRVQAKNSNWTTVRTFSNFNLLCGCCTLLPFPSALTSLCAPDAMIADTGKMYLILIQRSRHGLRDTHSFVLSITLDLLLEWNQLVHVEYGSVQKRKTNCDTQPFLVTAIASHFQQFQRSCHTQWLKLIVWDMFKNV